MLEQGPVTDLRVKARWRAISKGKTTDKSLSLIPSLKGNKRVLLVSPSTHFRGRAELWFLAAFGILIRDKSSKPGNDLCSSPLTVVSIWQVLQNNVQPMPAGPMTRHRDLALFP